MHDVYTAFLVSVLQTIPKQIENERERERKGELGHLDFKWTFENLIAEQAQQKTVVSIWNSMVEGQGMSTWVASIAHRGPAQRSSLFFTIISDSHYHFINYSFSLFFLSFFRFLCVCVFFFFNIPNHRVIWFSVLKKIEVEKKKETADATLLFHRFALYFVYASYYSWKIRVAFMEEGQLSTRRSSQQGIINS